MNGSVHFEPVNKKEIPFYKAECRFYLFGFQRESMDLKVGDIFKYKIRFWILLRYKDGNFCHNKEHMLYEKPELIVKN